MNSAAALARDLVHVKVCGIAQLSDAQAALSFGATMLGFIIGNERVQERLADAASDKRGGRAFGPKSRLSQEAQTVVFNHRHVLLESIAFISRELDKSTERVGVFYNTSREFILRSFETGNLTGVQLHGDESVEFVAKLRSDLGSEVFLLKAVETSHAAGRVQEHQDYMSSCSALLFDVPKAGPSGQKVLDLSCLKKMRPAYPFFIAGGLSQSNIEEFLVELKPHGIDVCSAVEESPGRKDPHKLRDFFRAVQRARHASLVIKRR